MRAEKIVQFVCFDTILGSEKFIAQWEHYNRSVNSDLDVTLQQSEHNGMFRYIAQHRCVAGELQFSFTRSRKPSNTPEVEIKTKQAGGYSVLQAEWMKDAHAGESKVFAFLTQPQVDLNLYRQLSVHSKLNIYEAYYENCQYAYILEFFVKNKYEAELLVKLKQNGAAEAGIYKEFVLLAT